MRSQVILLTSIVLAGFMSAGFAQTEEPGETGTPSFPYIAEITGDNVYIRSGPGTNFYHCGKLNQGDKVKVVSTQFSWSCIVPPAGSFSWISMQYVRIDPGDPSIGIVTGDSVRVYAGSDYVKPLYSTTLQGKLDRGDKVKLLSEQMDDYYKIAPPSFAYLWVSTNFTKPVMPQVGEITGPQGAEATAVEQPSEEPNDAALATAPKTSAEAKLEEYNALLKQIEAEQAKPMDEQDYSEIKKALSEIAKDKQAGKAARYAEYVIKQVEGFELALEVSEEVRLQNEQLQKVKDQIDKARAARLAEVKTLGKFAVIGQLQTFETYGPGHYRVLDESGKTVCYALPTEQASKMDLSRLIGRKVGLVGKIEPHRQTAGALVRFTEAVELK